MSNSSTQEATRTGIYEYLIHAYKVDEQTARSALEKHQTTVERAISDRSYNYYPGDRIAEAEGWEENPDFNPDGEEEEDDN